jgi:hypothetical protein
MALKRGENRGKLRECQNIVKVENELGENVIQSGWARLIWQCRTAFADDEDDEDRDDEHEDGR